MAVLTIPKDTSLDFVYDELTYTHARLAADPLTEHLAPVFAALIEEWDDLHRLELRFRSAITYTRAIVIAVDTRLDLAVDDLARSLLAITRNNRNDPLYTRYFRNKTPSQLKRPILGVELEEVQKWPESLANSPHEVLREIGKRFEVIIGQAHAAVADNNTAVADNRDYREVNERPTFIDKTNARRKSTEGELSEIVHSRSELHLPSSWPSGFYRRSRKNRTPTVEEVRAMLKENEAQKAKHEALLAQLLAAEKKRVEAEAKARAEAEAQERAEAQRMFEEAKARLEKLGTRKSDRPSS